MKSVLSRLALMALLVVPASVAQADCVICAYHPLFGCFGCAVGGGNYETCILGTPCLGFPGTYNSCANFGSCLFFSSQGDMPINFEPSLIMDVRQYHPRAAEMMTWVNEHGGLTHDRLVVHKADSSTPDPADTVEYVFSVRVADGRPVVVELSAPQPYSDAAPMTTLLFNLPSDRLATTAIGWMEL